MQRKTYKIDVKKFNIPFIYSRPQRINLDEDRIYYELKFLKKKILNK